MMASSGPRWHRPGWAPSRTETGVLWGRWMRTRPDRAVFGTVAPWGGTIPHYHFLTFLSTPFFEN